MSIFKKASPSPIVRTVVAYPGDEELDQPSNNSFNKMSNKDKVLDELDRMNVNVYSSGAHNNHYIEGYDKATRWAVELIQKYWK